MKGFFTKFATNPEDRDALVALLEQAARGMQGIEDCKLYVVSKDATDIAVTWVSEVWTDHETHRAALQVPDAKALIAKAMPLLTAGPEQTALDIVGGKGIE